MSADTEPISVSRFAAALKDLSVDTLHLKVLEIRNSIAHLQYSNDQLKPFAEGSAVAVSSSSASSPPSTSTEQQAAASTEPDQDCVEAIRENEQVIDRMAERIALIRAEVEERGISWTEFQSKDELLAKRAQEEEARRHQNGDGDGINGYAEREASAGGSEQQHSAWTDGTFQTGTIRNGEVRLDSQPGRPEGGSLNDDQLRQALEERMRNLNHEDDNDESEGGMHL